MKKLSFSSYEGFSRDFKVDLPSGYNVGFDLLGRIAREDPERLCIRHVNDAFERRDVTFKELDQAACRVANALKNLGIGKGDRVLLILYRRLEWWESLLGLHKLGAVAIPAPAQLTPHDIEFRLNKAGAKALIVDSSLVSRVDEVAEQCPDLKLKVVVGAPSLPAGWKDYVKITQAADAEFPRPAGAALACDTDPLLIFFSSGTTGLPTMVEHTHYYPLGHLFTGMYWHDLEPGDMHLTVADTGWGKAVWGKSYGQWMAGAAVFAYDFRGKFDPAALLKVIAEHGVTSFCGPPTVYRFLVREELDGYNLSSLRHCTTAGELLNESVFHDWKAATGLNIYEGYGQTETTLQIATLPFMEPKPGSIGRPVPGWEVELLRESGEPCQPGEEGEICVRVAENRHPALFTCYVGEEERTAKVLHDGWYHTGDKAWVDEDGYFWFLGRVDDLIKSSGYRIGPFEVESALVAHPAVVEAAVTGVPDPVRGQIVKATLVLAPGHMAGEELTRELQEHVKKVTAPYKYPRVVDYVAELPKTISGKIRRSAIREADALEQGEEREHGRGASA